MIKRERPNFGIICKDCNAHLNNKKEYYCVKCDKPVCSIHSFSIYKFVKTKINKFHRVTRLIIGRLCLNCNAKFDIIKTKKEE